MNRENFNFDHSAFMLVDLQYAYSAESDFKTKDWGRIVTNVKRLLSTCREKRIPVIFVRMWRRPDGADAHPNDPRNEAGKPLYAVAETREAEILDEIKPMEGEIIINKQRFSGFFQTNLNLTLQGLGVNHLIMCGVSTDSCFLTTVYDAFFRAYEITIVKDACGASTEAAHMTSILDMANSIYGCSIFFTEELIKAIKGEQFQAWFWERPCKYMYTLETIQEMYEQI